MVNQAEPYLLWRQSGNYSGSNAHRLDMQW